MTAEVSTSTNRVTWPEPIEGEPADLVRFALDAHIPSWEDQSLCMQCNQPFPCVTYRLAFATQKCYREH